MAFTPSRLRHCAPTPLPSQLKKVNQFRTSHQPVGSWQGPVFWGDCFFHYLWGQRGKDCYFPALAPLLSRDQHWLLWGLKPGWTGCVTWVPERLGTLVCLFSGPSEFKLNDLTRPGRTNRPAGHLFFTNFDSSKWTLLKKYSAFKHSLVNEATYRACNSSVAT